MVVLSGKICIKVQILYELDVDALTAIVDTLLG